MFKMTDEGRLQGEFILSPLTRNKESAHWLTRVLVGYLTTDRLIGSCDNCLGLCGIARNYGGSTIRSIPFYSLIKTAPQCKYCSILMRGILHFHPYMLEDQSLAEETRIYIDLGEIKQEDRLHPTGVNLYLLEEPGN